MEDALVLLVTADVYCLLDLDDSAQQFGGQALHLDPFSVVSWGSLQIDQLCKGTSGIQEEGRVNAFSFELQLQELCKLATNSSNTVCTC